MTKFEQVGINYQLSATTKADAEKSFEYSCNVCCHSPRCLYMDCDHCGIKQTHNTVIAVFADMAKEKEG